MSDESQGTASTRKSVSTRDMLDANGNVTKDWNAATGARYTLKNGAADGHAFDLQLGEPGKPETMLAIFGFHTKIGNVANSILNDKTKPGGIDDAADAIDEWLDGLKGGVWREKSESVGGARMDRDALAEAVVQVAESRGQMPAGVDRDTVKAKVRARIEDGGTKDPKAYARVVRADTEVSAAYMALVGHKGKTVENLLG